MSESYAHDKSGEELVRSDNVIFVGTGVTGGDLLRGVRQSGRAMRADSVVTDARSRTLRYVETLHLVDEE